MVVAVLINQMFFLGLPLGHTMVNSVYLARWCIKFWERQQIGLGEGYLYLKSKTHAHMNLLITLFQLRILLDMAMKAGETGTGLWYVCFHKDFSPYIARYAVLTGDCYFTYEWIPGTLTNSTVFFYFSFVVKLWSQGYKLYYKQRKRFLQLNGVFLGNKNLPGYIYMPRFLESYVAVREAVIARVPSATMVDSNIVSGMINAPIPGNDDSLLCINFFAYVFARMSIQGKMLSVLRWGQVIRKTHRRETLLLLSFLCFFFKDDNRLKTEQWGNYYGELIKKPFFNYSTNKVQQYREIVTKVKKHRISFRDNSERDFDIFKVPVEKGIDAKRDERKVNYFIEDIYA